MRHNACYYYIIIIILARATTLDRSQGGLDAQSCQP